MPMQTLYSNAVGLSFLVGGGGPASPLVPGANPPAQYAVSGTTSLSFTFLAGKLKTKLDVPLGVKSEAGFAPGAR